jgi:uncharacterized protein (UPF0147 family)
MSAPSPITRNNTKNKKEDLFVLINIIPDTRRSNINTARATINNAMAKLSSMEFISSLILKASDFISFSTKLSKDPNTTVMIIDPIIIDGEMKIE